MRDVSEIVHGTKLHSIYEIIMRDGKISNVETLKGSHGVRTNRLSAFVFILKDNYGMEFETKEIRNSNGTYIDFEYILKDKKIKNTLF